MERGGICLAVKHSFKRRVRFDHVDPSKMTCQAVEASLPMTQATTVKKEHGRSWPHRRLASGSHINVRHQQHQERVRLGGSLSVRLFEPWLSLER